MIVVDKGKSNGNKLVNTDVQTFIEKGVTKATSLDMSSKTNNIQNKPKSYVSHVQAIKLFAKA